MEAFVRTHTWDELGLLLDLACRDAVELLPADGCHIARLVEGLLVDAGSYSEKLVLADGHVYLVSDYPLTGRVLATRSPAIAALDDPEVDPSEAFVLETVGAHSVLLLPLLVDGRTWGLVEIYRTSRRAFTEADLALASIIAVAIGGMASRMTAREQVRLVYHETLASLANALASKDSLTQVHTEDVASLALALGERLELGASELEDLHLGALLHDVGKIRVPDSILNKSGPLSEEEWEVMRQHTLAGEAILAPLSSLQGVLPIVRSHHERWDGQGYPDGLRGEAIPLGARIVAVCDAFSAMSEDRPYRSWRERDAIREELTANAGWQFDPTCVSVLLEVLDEREQAASRPQPAPIRRPTLARSQ
jgi:HD domain-containing protein/GAF domain-containing protein